MPSKKYIEKYTDICKKNKSIDSELYAKYDVKRGLRDINGNGVLAGLTEVGEVKATDNGNPCPGKLYYHGYDVEDLIRGAIRGERFGFEEVVYLLLFGELPSNANLIEFKSVMNSYRKLPLDFVRDVIMKAPSKDIMNMLSRSVLMLYTYDEKADDISIPNVLRQSIQLIAQFPVLAIYGYQAYCISHGGSSLIMHSPKPELSTAENILYMLRKDCQYTPLEARVLDLALILHAEHAGGNNSTFTTHVVTSSGTDTYSSVAASLGSLKGPKHGGANIKVSLMFEDMRKTLRNPNDDREVEQYLVNLLHKKAFDKSGLIYGMGHAVYSISDPRVEVFKLFVEKLAREKNRMEEFELYSKVEHLAPQIIASERQIYKGVSANVDFYSGFVYSMLDIPTELYTPLFAISRIAGWSAHRLEELVNPAKIVRPAYKNIAEHREYVDIDKR
ncbi:MAG: citrate/2-methylcitrate synthase [Monoglobaceae bacterium]